MKGFFGCAEAACHGARRGRMMQEPETVERASLEDIAMLAMEFGRLLMECGASARIVEEIVGTVARGLGAERVDLRIGYASLAITVGIGGEGITRMRKVGPLGVNQRLDHSLRELAGAVRRGEFTASAARLEAEQPHPDPPAPSGLAGGYRGRRGLRFLRTPAGR